MLENAVKEIRGLHFRDAYRHTIMSSRHPNLDQQELEPYPTDATSMPIIHTAFGDIL